MDHVDHPIIERYLASSFPMWTASRGSVSPPTLNQPLLALDLQPLSLFFHMLVELWNVPKLGCPS
jgi:hypothetical protein